MEYTLSVRAVALTLLLAVVLAFPAPAEARRRRRHTSTPTRLTPAKKAFRHGSALFAAKDYVGALEAFRLADSLKPHFLLQCNMARCLERMGKLVEAVVHYRACLTRGASRHKAMGRKVARALETANARITWVEVTSPGQGGTVYLNGLARGPTPAKLAIDSGRSVIEVRRRGATPAGTTIDTAGGEKRTLELVPRQIQAAVTPLPRAVDDGPEYRPRRRGLSQVWFWSVAALAVGLATASTVLGVQALQRKADYEDYPTRQGYNDAKDRRLLANLFWGATLAAAGSATTLFFFTDFGRRESRDELAFSVGLRGSF